MASQAPVGLQPVPIGTPEQFFSEFVAARKPALLGGLAPDLAHLPRLWTDAHLISKAGDAVLQVEQRGGEGDAFGRGEGSKVALTLREALGRMAAGDTRLYITTQAVPTAPDGHPALYASPVAELAPDIPLSPALMGSLVPQSINLWLGATPHGSSSGLHCDYHDNLYVLLRGRKRFRLYPPSMARRMCTVGRVARVHPNGRIVFEGQGDILPDGSEAGDAARWQARARAEAELAAAEAAASRGLPGAAKRLRAAERRLDAALEAALEGGDDFDAPDDFDALEAGGAAQPPPPAAAGDPDSFSRVDLALPDAELRRRFPRFSGKAAALVAEVTARQMLFLPAGWFHEVSSFSDPQSGPTHMALNYWFHPPDRLEGGAAALQRPYRSGYWPAVWEGRRAQYAARHRQWQDGAQQAGCGIGEADASAEQAARKKRRTSAEDAAAAMEQRLRQGSERRRQPPRPARLPGSLGLFGIGRRQHLHRFVTVKKKS